MNHRFKIGDVVRIQTWGDGVRTGIITQLDEKDGYPVYSYRCGEGEFWCYDEQVIS